jgi:hypothetical protein
VVAMIMMMSASRASVQMEQALGWGSMGITSPMKNSAWERRDGIVGGGVQVESGRGLTLALAVMGGDVEGGEVEADIVWRGIVREVGIESGVAGV